MYFTKKVLVVAFLGISLALFNSGTLTYLTGAEPPQAMDIKDAQNEDGVAGITVNFFVKGKPADVWKWIRDVDHLNKLFPAVKKIVKVKEVDASTTIWNYTLETSLGTKNFNVQRSFDDKDLSIKWKKTEGDMKYYGGSWKIKASETYAGWVDCTYSNFVNVGWYLPYAVVKKTSKQNAESMVPSLRKLVAGK